MNMGLKIEYLTMLHDSFRKSDELLVMLKMEICNGQ